MLNLCPELNLAFEYLCRLQGVTRTSPQAFKGTNILEEMQMNSGASAHILERMHMRKPSPTGGEDKSWYIPLEMSSLSAPSVEAHEVSCKQ